MVIGLDIDDTMTNSSELITQYAKNHFNADDSITVNNILHAKNVNEDIKSFYNLYLSKMVQNYVLKDNVKEVIDHLRLKGNKIIIITFRGYGEYKDLIPITKEYFEQHNIIVDKIVFSQKDKSQSCLENNVDIMVDDSIDVLEKIKEKGIQPLLFNSISNKDITTNIDRVKSWLELEKYIDNIL